jgi:hypothetical protein
MARTFPTSVTGYLGSQFQKKTWFFWHSFLMALTIGDDVGVLFPWSVHISKYGNPCKYSQKIRKKGENTLICTVVENVGGFTWSVHISKYRNNSNKIGEK